MTTDTYSVRGWVSTKTDPMGYVVTYTYSATGKNVGTDQYDGIPVETSILYYDADDRLIAETDGNGNTTSFAYDGVGNQISMTYTNHNITTYAYDSMNQLATVTDAAGRCHRDRIRFRRKPDHRDRRPGAHGDDTLRRPEPPNHHDQRDFGNHDDKLRRG